MNKSSYIAAIVIGLMFLFFAQANSAQKIPLELAGQLIRDDASVREKIREKRWAAKTASSKVANEINSVKKIDLNGDGSPEFIISGIICGTANCRTWIYRKTGAKYNQIPFESYDVGFKVQKTKSNGYFDLMTEGRNGAASEILRVFKFDGKKYVIRECFEKSYADSNGNIYKTPKTTKIKCGT